jgi:hypothetical protein
LDVDGNLWVADGLNNRVLEFKPPFSSGMAASLVLGQPDFKQNFAGSTNAAMKMPTAIAFDGNGTLFVTDQNNNRTLMFAPPFSNGMAATSVIGQTDFTSISPNQGGNAQANTQYTPSAVALSY